MTSMEAEVRTALEKFRRGDDETAFFELIEMPGDVLTGIIDVFHAEPRADVRAFLVKAAWERREETVIRFLAEALNDPAEEVWQQALDGLVAFSLPSSLKVLQSARSRKFTEATAANRFNLWLEEAIQQVELELRSKA
jgi:HEAT repeat protein